MHSTQKHKHKQQKAILPLNAREIQDRAKKLTQRLSRESICKQHKLIANMNLKLEVRLQQLMKLDQLKNLTLQEAIKVIQKVGCLQMVVPVSTGEIMHSSSKQANQQLNAPNSKQKNINDKKKHQQDEKNTPSNDKLHHDKYEPKKQLLLSKDVKQLFKLKYPNAEKTIILAGINRTWIQNSLKDFNGSSSELQNVRSSSYKKHPSMTYHNVLCHISGVNDFWIAVQADTHQNAQAFKKFIRMRKKSCEQRKDFSFKEDKRRVRIVMQNEDFYTLLVDAMTEKKNSQFIKRLINPNSGMFPAMCLRDSRKFTAFPNEEYQLGLKKANKILYFPIVANRPQSKDGDDQFALDEVYSEDRSRASQLFDSTNNLEDLMPKSDQGTQSMAIGTQDEQTGMDDETLRYMNENTNEENGEITCEMVSMNPRNKVHEQKSWQSLGGFEKQLSSQIGQNNQGMDSVKESQNNENQNGQKIGEQKRSIEDINHIEDSEIESEHGEIVVPVVQSHSQQQKQKKQKINQVGKVQKNEKENIEERKAIFEKGCKEQGMTENKPLQLNQNQPIKLQQNDKNHKPLSLNDLRQPQVPPKLLTIYFSTHAQTDRQSLNYTKMKRLESEYLKKSASRMKLTPGIPEQFRQVSQQERNRDLFFVNIFKSMERRSQKKEWISDFN